MVAFGLSEQAFKPQGCTPACEASRPPNLPLCLLVQLCMFLLPVFTSTFSLKCSKSRKCNVNSIAFCSLGVFFQSNCKYDVYFIIAPRRVLSPPAT